MSDPERQAFEAQLQSDEALRQEVAVYGQLFDGFDELKTEAFRQEVAKWTSEAKANSLSGRASIIALKPSRFRRNIAIAASLLLLISAGLVWWTSQQYTTIEIVQQAYSPPLSEQTMGSQTLAPNSFEKTFEAGHQFFQEGDYAKAIEQFEVVIGALESNAGNLDQLTRSFYMENAKWTHLLARFADGQLTDNAFSAELDTFVNDPSGDYADKAAELQNNLNSFWRKLGR